MDEEKLLKRPVAARISGNSRLSLYAHRGSMASRRGI